MISFSAFVISLTLYGQIPRVKLILMCYSFEDRFNIDLILTVYISSESFELNGIHVTQLFSNTFSLCCVLQLMYLGISMFGSGF